MSRGPGRVERAIRDLMSSEPWGAWRTYELCERVYPGIDEVEKKHQVSVRRALLRAVQGSNRWGVIRTETRGNHLLLVNFANLDSYALGRLKSEIDREEEDLLVRLKEVPHYVEWIAEGGGWWRDVQEFKAKMGIGSCTTCAPTVSGEGAD